MDRRAKFTAKAERNTLVAIKAIRRLSEIATRAAPVVEQADVDRISDALLTEVNEVKYRMALVMRGRAQLSFSLTDPLPSETKAEP